MCNLLHCGRKIEGLIFPPGGYYDDIEVGKNGVAWIMVRPANGQMAEVAWFEVMMHGELSMHNAAHVQSVRYAKEGGEDG